jgi:DME family drug/metabolite transporter
MALFQICFFSSLRLTGVAIGTMVAVGSAPIGGRRLRKNLLRRASYVALGNRDVARGRRVLSAVAFRRRDHGEFLGRSPRRFASVCYALCGIGIKGIGRVRPSEDAAIAALGLGALVLSPIFFSSDMSWIVSARGWASRFIWARSPRALPYSLFSWGLKFTPMSKAYTLTLTEPLTAFSARVLFLERPMSFTSACGVALLLAGLLCCPSGRSEREKRGDRIHAGISNGVIQRELGAKSPPDSSTVARRASSGFLCLQETKRRCGFPA